MGLESARTSEDQFAAPSFQLQGPAGSRGVIVIDNDRCVAYTDSNVFHLLGIEPSSIVGRTREEAVEVIKGRLRDPREYEASCRRVWESPEEVLDDVLELAGDDARVIHRYSAPLFDEFRACIGRVEIFSDITRRRELEGAVKRAYQDLRAAQDQLVQSEKLRAVGEIASGVAHDFNNILGIILGNIQLLQRSVTEPRALAKLESAQRAAQDGVDTVRRIQEFTRSLPEEPPVMLSLSKLAAQVVEMMRPVVENTAKSAGCEIKVALDAGAEAWVKGSAHELREVVTNLLLNAAQAMPQGGKIEVSTGIDGSNCWVRIKDDGVGMSEDTRKRVFDPFFTTRGVAGTGLGMSVAYGIAKRHGGRISVESEPEVGTTITVTLPSVEIPATIAGDSGAGLAVSGKSARVLVIDDEELFARAIVEMLEVCGHSAASAADGGSGVEAFRSGEFDLVITDLGMPGMSGWQVAEAIKEISGRTPVVMLTGWGAAIDRTELERSKVDVVLAKPVTIEKLSAVVEEALSRNG